MMSSLICSNATHCENSKGCPHAVPHQGVCGPSMPCYDDPSGQISKCIPISDKLKFAKNPYDTIRQLRETLKEANNSIYAMSEQTHIGYEEQIGLSKLHSRINKVLKESENE